MEQKTFKILAVDDIEDNLEVIGNTFSGKNISLTFASNGRQALKAVEKKHPDLILLDINMPDMDGFEVCQILKTNKLTKDIPIIFLSAYSEKEDIIKGFEYGAVDYITKPFHKTELISRVFTHLELKYSKDLLNKQNLELKKINTTKDKFFSIIAHDLKSPFNTILGFSELLLKNYDNYDKEKTYHFIKNIHLSANNAYKLLENLLTWSRSQINHIDFVPEKINVKSLIDETFNYYNTSAEKKSIKLNNYADEAFTVKADKNMFSTILRNLISNAIKYTKENGKVSLNTEFTDNNYIKICIQDNGVGIPAENLKNIFHVNKTISTPGTQEERGTGLGLILCNEFVSKHNGKIWVESKINSGTTFCFTLPASD